jgi:hypothetical protein
MEAFFSWLEMWMQSFGGRMALQSFSGYFEARFRMNVWAVSSVSGWVLSVNPQAG